MSTESAIQVLGAAVDTAGVSTVTATRTVTQPRNGVIYNPTTFAAAPPVWFHRMHDGRYLALFKYRWHTATAAYNDGPQVFSAHSVDTQPCYAYIDPTTGAIEGPYPWPGLDTLNSAVSRNDYLFTLGTKDGQAVVQHSVITRLSGLQLQGYEEVPLGFGLGLWADGFNLYVYGAIGGVLGSVRKNWGRIGINSDPQNQWAYLGIKGWYTNPSEVAPLPGNIPAAGPVSAAKKGDRSYLVATELSGSAYRGRVFTSRVVDSSWKPTNAAPIPLGDTTTYLGGGVYLQPQLVSTASGIPYVTSEEVTVGSDQTILTEWGTLAV